LNIRIIRA